MAEKTLTTDDVLMWFIRPPLDALRPDLVSNWAAGYGDGGFGQEVISTPRLKDRIARDICNRYGQDHEIAAPDASYRKVLSAIGIMGAEKLALILGCILHRATVLDWITWNQLNERLPDLTNQEARIILTAVSDGHIHDIGIIPFGFEADLTHTEIAEVGFDLLWTWHMELPADLRERLFLFCEPYDLDPDRDIGGLVETVCNRIVEEYL